MFFHIGKLTHRCVQRVGACLVFMMLSGACGSKSEPEPTADDPLPGIEDPSGENGDEGTSGEDEDFLPEEETPAEPGSGIKGIVYYATPDFELAPVAGATVAVLDSNPKVSATTGDDGSYVVAVADGEHWLSVSAQGYWGVVERLTAPLAEAVLPLLSPDNTEELAGMTKANTAPLDVKKGIVRVSVSKETEPYELPAGITVALSTNYAKILLPSVNDVGGFEVVTAIPAGPDGGIGFELVDVGVGAADVQVTAPNGLDCTPTPSTLRVEPKAFTFLEIYCK